MYRIDSVCIKVDDLVGSIRDSCLLHCARVTSEFIHDAFKSLGHKGAGDLNRPRYLICVGEGHNTGDDGDRDSCFSNLIKKIIQQILYLHPEKLGRFHSFYAFVFLFLKKYGISLKE